MGSMLRVKVTYTNLPEFLSSIDPMIKIYGSFPKGENIYSVSLDQISIILIGSESSGISRELVSKVTDKISIPSFVKARGAGDQAESLNASVAAGIICSEFRRRKG
jgi:TrmH family RNA methyltransferase